MIDTVRTNVISEDVLSDNSVADTAKFVMRKSSIGALLRSAVLPGWGQIYNESYWKAPVIWAAVGVMAGIWKWNDDRYEKNRKLTAQYAHDTKSASYKNYRQSREFYRDQRNEVALYMGLVYALNLLDAYVDAHMFDFSVSGDPVTSAPMLQMRLNF